MSKRLAAALLLSLCCSACMVGPDYRPPEPDSPAQWSGPLQGGITTAETDAGGQWWKGFGDPVLDALVERALASNTDLVRALARVRAARAARHTAIASMFPSAGAGAGYDHRRLSGTSVAAPESREFDEYSIGFDASWEIDLFGGLGRAREKAIAELEAAGADLADALVTVLAEVARNYVELRSLQARIAIALSNVTSQQETVDLASWRYDAGLVGALDVEQARYNLAQTRARIPALRSELAAAGNRIAVLLGQSAGTLDSELELPRPVPLPPRSMAIGMPAELLRRRPDVAAAERRLEAATAAIGIAKAELYPKLAINGTFDITATDLARLDAAASRGFGIGPSLRWNLFDAGRLRSIADQRSAETDVALADWKTEVLGALEEAENALAAYVHEQERREHLRDAVVAARRAHELARLQYESGLVDFQRVLEAQRALLGFEESLAISEAAVTTGVIALYKALGGGWQVVDCAEDGPCRLPA